MKTIIVPLDQSVLQQHLATLLCLDAETDGERWGPEHFLLDRPGKWDCSRLALDTAGRVAGFAVASIQGSALHVHRLVVARDQRSRGLGTRLLLAMARVAQRRSLATISLKLARTNTGARRLYERLGFVLQANAGGNLVATVAPAQLRHRASGAALAALQGD